MMYDVPTYDVPGVITFPQLFICFPQHAHFLPGMFDCSSPFSKQNLDKLG
jgi:hypothetical protein